MCVTSSHVHVFFVRARAQGKLDEAGAAAAVSEPMSRISTTANVADLKDADLIIEAIAENLEIKQKFFKSVGEVAKPDAIIATNTSSLSIKDMADACGRPQHTIGLHYFNPVQLMPVRSVV